MDDNYGLTDEQIDQLVDGMQVNVNQVEDPETTPTEPPPQEPAPTEQPSYFMKLKVDGKEIEATEDQIRQWASQGHNYGRHMNEFKGKQDEFNRQTNEFNDKYGTYQKIDEYARNHPQWWENVKNSYEQVTTQDPTQTGGQLPAEVAGVIDELRNQVSELSKFQESQLQERKEAQEKAEDEQLSNEISQIRQQNTDLDWTSLDANGKSLELRVLEHAKQIGTQSFRAAFRDMMHDELLNRNVAKAKDETLKTIQRNNKLGLLGDTPDPLKRYMPTEGKAKDWDGVLEETLNEYGITE